MRKLFESRETLFRTRVEMPAYCQPIAELDEGTNLPDDSESKGRIHVNEQRCNFVPIVEHEAVPPSDNGAPQRSMGQTVAGEEERRVGRHKPDEDDVEDVAVVA